MDNTVEPQESFQWLAGRRHIASAPYVLPSDGQEINRLDFQHYMLRAALHGNYVAPIQSPKRILDVGCGTGRWAREMAQQFPDAEVIGIDIVPPTRQEEDQPKNCTFFIGDVLEKLSFVDDYFDFVHMRLLLFAIPAASWPSVISELIRVTKPDGWIESVETGAQSNCGPAMERIVGWINQAAMHRNVNLALGPSIGNYLQQLGLRGTQRHQLSLPIGSSQDRLSQMALTDTFAVVNGVKGMCVAYGIVSASEFEQAVAQARREIVTRQGRLPFYIAYGRRSSQQ